ncbi:cupredoxin domain-containing protein [Corynebacterium suranareeae]|uniref:cupredoxin domain-containing protein n=1 Tax=Corynebacterium suranareeae TaxID=2506452 RepID=UPI000BBA83B5
MVLVVAGLIHPLLPEYRWVLIHLFTLGAITNSIVVWSQHFTEKFLHLKLDDSKRPAQLMKIRLLNVGIIVTIIGQMVDQWIVTSVGATFVGLALAWHAGSLAAQFRSAKHGQPFASAVVAYVASACCLPFGAFAGALLSKELSGNLQERVLLTHSVINFLGFVGFAALGSLSVLFAAIWRTKIRRNFTPWSVGIMAIALPIIVAGILLDNGYVTAAGLAAYAAAWLLCMAGWGKASISNLSFSTSTSSTAPLWLVGTLAWLAVQAVIHNGELYHVEVPTIALVIGFGAQLLIGVMSYLLPSTMGGGASAVRTGTHILNTAGLFRWTLLNGGLAIWLLTDNSWLRVIVSLLSIGALAIFVILLPKAVRAQRGVITKTREPITPPEGPRLNQITAGISVLALILAAFGGLNPGVAPVASTNSDVYPVTITAGDMVFIPDVIEVPAGKSLEVTMINEDDMVHDLKFANGVQTGRVAPGDEITVTVGDISEDMEGWCTIAGHHAQGMDLEVKVPAPTQP